MNSEVINYERENQVVVTQTKQQARIFKVIVIGDSNVGKTTLTYRFCQGKFLDKAEATIGVDFRSKTLNIDGEDVTVSIFHSYNFIGIVII